MHPKDRREVNTGQLGAADRPAAGAQARPRRRPFPRYQKGFARFDVPADASAADRDRAFATIKKAGMRFGIRISRMPFQPSEGRPHARNTLLD
jgi:hypothetical protein